MKNRVYFGIRKFLILAFLLPACALEEPNISSENTSTNQNVSMTDEQMIISGKILAVMESWPLQLRVETSSGSYDVQLLEDTKITRQGQVVEPGELKSDMQVKIEGQGSNLNSHTITASTIKILEPAK